MPKKPDTFAVRLARLREARGWSAYRLAKEAGVTSGQLSHLESGRRGPTLETARKLARALGVSLAEWD
jgi:transcriptional regulator with XRE-family HTH domain